MLLSPLRYPGGKAKLYDYFTDLISCNNLFRSTYCEPYAGGAGLALRLLSNGFVERASLNDLDFTIYAFWRSVLDHTDDFCALIESIPVNMDEWFIQNKVWREAQKHDILKLGFATFFLNRTNRSGIIEGAGPIGGYKQDGFWKMDVRFNKTALINTVMGVGRLRSRITFSNIDAALFIPENLSQENTMMYLDPPYYAKGSKLYKNFYKHEDHRQIHDILVEHRAARWIVSYDNAPQIREIYKDFQPISYKLNYSAGTKILGDEVMYYSDKIRPPNRTRVMRTA